MNRYAVVLAVALVAAASGCVQTSANTGNFELLISDRPSAIGDFSTLNVTLSEARVFKKNSSGFETLSLNSTVVDLTELQGEKAAKVLDVPLESGNYTKVELHVSKSTGLVNGSIVDVKVPSQKLMITKNFEIRPNKTTKFVFDIQVVKKGQGGYNLIPVISKSGVAGKDVEAEEVERKGRAQSSNRGRAP